MCLTVKDHLGDYEAGICKDIRQVVWFEFTNGKTASFSVTYSDGKYRVQSMNDSTFGWKTHHELSTTEIASYQDENGIDFRVVRTGTLVDIYLDGTKVCTGIDLATNSSGNATNVTADMAVTVTIRHYGNVGYKVNIPFTIASADVVETYNTQLFYANDKKTNVADPFVLDNTAVDGYYYLYGTQGACYCYRSKNMMDWEKVGDTIQVSEVVATDIWAPEVVYDADEELYYMFFSATPTADAAYTDGNATQVLFVATSKYPYKDFALINFKDESSCGVDNVHDYSTTAYPHYYAEYLFFDPAKYDTFSDKDGGYLGAIDPHPYIDVDENGKETKYLFWVDSRGEDRICGVQMENWLKPMWETATVLTHYGYYTEADWKEAQAGGTVTKVVYEMNDNTINEGPSITKHNGKYYLTFSANAYASNNYLVAQAVSDSILGDYRKLTIQEGGILLTGAIFGTKEASGTGHHSFVTIGKQTYIVYHRHNDAIAMGSARNHAIDEIHWITVTDVNGDELDVMYANGPTVTPQPRIEVFSKYKNIVGDAEISGVEDVSCLTDGLLSIQNCWDEALSQYIKDATITETTTISFDYKEPRTIGAIMIYSSLVPQYSFLEPIDLEVVCVEDGKEVIRRIENLEMNPEYYRVEDNGLIAVRNYISPGASIYTEFEDWNVKSIKVTIHVQDGQDFVSISEIKILGQ